MQGNRAKEKPKKKRWIPVLIVIAVAIAVVAVAWGTGALSAQKPAQFAADDRAQDIDYSGSNRSDVLAELQKKADESSFSFKINSNPVFENGTAEGNLYIENPVVNAYDMRVEITLDDTGETVYETGLISPGQSIVRDALDVALGQGTYTATATIHAHDRKTGTEIGRTAAELQIEVTQ